MPQRQSFESLAATTSTHAGSQTLFRELCGFMTENTKWWLTPFLIVFALLGAALALGATGAAPFIYTLF